MFLENKKACYEKDKKTYYDFKRKYLGVFGCSEVGKTTWVIQLLTSGRFTPSFRPIQWGYRYWDDAYDDLKVSNSIDYIPLRRII